MHQRRATRHLFTAMPTIRNQIRRSGELTLGIRHAVLKLMSHNWNVGTTAAPEQAARPSQAQRRTVSWYYIIDVMITFQLMKGAARLT